MRYQDLATLATGIFFLFRVHSALNQIVELRRRVTFVSFGGRLV